MEYRLRALRISREVGNLLKAQVRTQSRQGWRVRSGGIPPIRRFLRGGGDQRRGGWLGSKGGGGERSRFLALQLRENGALLLYRRFDNLNSLPETEFFQPPYNHFASAIFYGL